MRASYDSELKLLYGSYRDCLSTQIDGLKECIDILSSYPLIAVGSGGSYPVAHLISDIHRHYTGRFACAKTPLEFASEYTSSRSAMLIVSAGGSNPDALMALKAGLRYGMKEIVIVTSTVDSALNKFANQYGYIHTLLNTVSPGKDGFLATNWSLTTPLLFLLQYIKANALACTDLPSDLGELIHPNFSKDEFRRSLNLSAEKLDEKKFLSVLYGGWTKSAAIDLESRLVESGIFTPQLADLRNFAHGRHQWLVRRGESTGIIILDYPSLTPLTDRTTNYIPESIPKIRLSTYNEGPIAGFATLVLSIFLLGALATRNGVDPANPMVPLWCRKIYNINHTIKKIKREDHIIRMKIGPIYNEQASKRWHELLSSEIEYLNSATIRSMVLDLDGTLVDSKNRFLPIGVKIKKHLNNLLSQGMVIGIATGRGKSVGSILREATRKKFHNQILVGYYNCSEIRPLSEENPRDVDNLLATDVLDTFEKEILYNIKSNIIIEKRAQQLSLTPMQPVDKQQVWRASQEVIIGNALPLKAIMSGHSVDIIDHKLSKARIIDFLKARVKCKDDEILRIGDQGAWPGNDFELLNHRLGLSVDEVSNDKEKCWNMGAEGELGTILTARYFCWLKLKEEYKWQLDIDL